MRGIGGLPISSSNENCTMNVMLQNVDLLQGIMFLIYEWMDMFILYYPPT